MVVDSRCASNFAQVSSDEEKLIQLSLRSELQSLELKKCFEVSDNIYKKKRAVKSQYKKLQKLRTALLDLKTQLNSRYVATELKKLRQGLKNSLVDVKRCLSLGWIGVQDMLLEKDLYRGQRNLMKLWQAFYPLLLHLKNFLRELAKLFKFWEKILYLLLLLSSFSEFPNRLRPPCTTMPWTIWPALVVLWGVCWMFYEPPNWNWETYLLEEQNVNDHSQGFNSIPPNFDYNAPERNLSLGEPIDPGQRLHQYLPEPATNNYVPNSWNYVPSLLSTDPQSTVTLLAFTDADPDPISNPTPVAENQANGTSQEATEGFQSGSKDSGTLATQNTLLVQGLPRNSPSSNTEEGDSTKPSQNSRHSQTEQYFCPYQDCKRSKSGSGFRRRDNLNQHLKGVHKHVSVARVRSRPAATYRSHTPVITSEPAPTPLQSKKRGRESDPEVDANDAGKRADRIMQELAEERRSRVRADEEIERLRRKLDKYEERMEKYEERLDRMLTLLEQCQSEESRKG